MSDFETRFKVAKAKLMTEGGELAERWLITDNLIPDYRINEWVEIKSMRKVSTGREYAYKLTGFLNYLNFCGKEYGSATAKDVLAFVLYSVYGYNENLKIHSLVGQISNNTLSKYITVITEFYKWLDNNYTSNMTFGEKNLNIKTRKSFLYGQIWNYNYKYIVDKHIQNLKGSKEYVKWYTAEEKDRLTNQFLTLRDRAVFLVTLEGFRIDEVLSMQLEDYDGETIRPSRSKGLPDGSKHMRTIALPAKTCKMLDEYIFTERAAAETNSGIVNQFIFINIKCGINQGHPFCYRSYWEIFKRCATRCGIDPAKVRTHSGRSTKVMEFLECQVTNPEKNITDSLILYHFGWRSLESISHYRNFDNKIIAKSAFDKLHGKENSNDK